MDELLVTLYSVPLDEEIVLTMRCAAFPDGFEAAFWESLTRWYDGMYHHRPSREFLRAAYELVRVERAAAGDSDGGAAFTAAQLTCEGCRYRRPGQRPHMGEGGCLEGSFEA